MPGICGTAFEVEHGVIHRVRPWYVEDRILRGLGKHLANLCLPDLPRVRAPEIIHPQEAALEQVRPEFGRILAREEQPAHFLHDDDRALKQLLVCEADDEMTRLARASKATLIFVNSETRIERSMSASG
jgi:hypothetical protein